MKLLKVVIIGVNLTLLCPNLLAQQTIVSDNLRDAIRVLHSNFLSVDTSEHSSRTGNDSLLFLAETEIDLESLNSINHFQNELSNSIHNNQRSLRSIQPKSAFKASHIDLGFSDDKNESFLNNRLHRYSSLWAFASLNYLYADLVGVMDKNKLVQYQTGVVEGVKITPQFLTVAAAFMQIPLANVFLPQLIKNEKTLRWVQIASGTLMTLVQAGTLFVGRPTPYYTLFSAFEIAATTYITIDAIKWKAKSNRKK